MDKKCLQELYTIWKNRLTEFEMELLLGRACENKEKWKILAPKITKKLKAFELRRLCKPNLSSLFILKTFMISPFKSHKIMKVVSCIF